MKSVKTRDRFSSGTVRPTAETAGVTVFERPKGFPIAITVSPINGSASTENRGQFAFARGSEDGEVVVLVGANDLALEFLPALGRGDDL
jgi:hypothetical protein